MESNRNEVPGVGTAHQDEWIDIGRLLEALYQQRATIVLTGVFCVVLSILYSLMATEIYEARSIVEVYSRRPRIMTDSYGAAVDNQSASTASSALNTQFFKLQGAPVRGEVVQALRHAGGSFAQVRNMTPLELDFFIQNNVTFELIDGTHLVAITVRSDGAEFSQFLANTYADVVIEHVKQSTKETAMGAVEWLAEQVEEVEKDLLAIEAADIAFMHERDYAGMQYQPPQ